MSLLQAIKSIFRTATERRLSEIAIPVIGSGHGGLDFNIALFLILLQGIICMKHEGYHHIKQMTVVIYDKSGNLKNQMEKVVKAVALIV